MKFGYLVSVLVFPLAVPAQAGLFEWSLGLNYGRTEYAGGSYTTQKRYGTSVGYNFSELSQIEFSFQEVLDRQKFVNFEDSTYHDRIYSFNWVQSLLPREAKLQPYFRGGIGQLNREANVRDFLGRSQRSQIDSITGVVGAGLRIFFTRELAFRMEGTSYLTGARLSTWRDNFAVTFGASLFF
jgi:hypothetical protein